MDKKLKENIVVGIKIVGMLFFLIVLITNLIDYKKKQRDLSQYYFSLTLIIGYISSLALFK